MNNVIRRSLASLMKNDAYILAVDINERSATHKLAEHLQLLLPEWNVDCEYNRNLNAPKEIDFSSEEFVKSFLQKMAELLKEEYSAEHEQIISHILESERINREDIDNLIAQLQDASVEYDAELDAYFFILKLRDGKTTRKTVYPDIIVHHRGTNNNLMILEIKKSKNTHAGSRLYDLIKLLTFVRSPEFGYKFGYFIDLPTGSDLAKHKEFRFTADNHESKVTKVYSI